MINSLLGKILLSLLERLIIFLVDLFSEWERNHKDSTRVKEINQKIRDKVNNYENANPNDAFDEHP